MIPYHLIKRFANNLLQMQQQQTKLTLGFINAINNNNLLNNYQNTNNKLNKNENNIHLNLIDFQNSKSSKLNSNPNQTINHKAHQKKYKRKRTYNQMLEESMSIESEANHIII